MIYTIKITKNFLYFIRQLEEDNSSQGNITSPDNDIQKEQLRDLYIYIAVLVVIVILILGGYALYRKCVEKKALDEIEREYQIMIMNLLNSNSSQVSSSQEDKRPQSYNNINPHRIQNFENEFVNQNASLDLNHEERMENIRKKFGNSVIIRCLLKKQIEEIQYTKKIGEDFGDRCTICVENFGENDFISKTPCEHIFHKKCFDTYLKEIQKKDKLLCPNCNQNLLINKKFLKLRAKTKKVEIKKKKTNQKDEKESEINLENEMKNRNSQMTNKNEDHIPDNNNEIIFIKKKHKKELNKIDNKNIHIFKDLNNNNNIYNPLHIRIRKNELDSKNDKDTIIPNDKNEDEEDENKKKIKIKKRNIVVINNIDKKNSSLKNSLSNESKAKFNSKRRKINISVNSERDGIVFSKNTLPPMLPSTKNGN